MFCGCPPSVKRCDAMDHCFSLVACMPVFIVWEGQNAFEWADATVGWKGDGVYYLQFTLYSVYPLDSNDFQSTYGAKKSCFTGP